MQDTSRRSAKMDVIAEGVAASHAARDERRLETARSGAQTRRTGMETARSRASRVTRGSETARTDRTFASVSTSYTAIQKRKEDLMDELHDVARRLDFAVVRREALQRTKPAKLRPGATKLEKRHNELVADRYTTHARATFQWASKEERALNDKSYGRVRARDLAASGGAR